MRNYAVIIGSADTGPVAYRGSYEGCLRWVNECNTNRDKRGAYRLTLYII